MLRYFLLWNIVWTYTVRSSAAASEDTSSVHSVLSTYKNAIGISKIDSLNSVFWTRTASVPGLLYMPFYNYQKQSATTDTAFSAIHFLGKKLFASVSEDGKGGQWFIWFLAKKKGVLFLVPCRKGDNKKRNKDPIRYVYSDLIHLSRDERDLLSDKDTLFTYEGTKKKKKDAYKKSLVRYKKYRDIQGIRYPSVLRLGLLKSKIHTVIWNASYTDAISRYPLFALLREQLNAVSDKHP